MLIAFSGAIAVAVAMRTGLPIMQPSPRKSPGPIIARTASLPCGLTMDSLAFPDWMYKTSSHGSSCEKMTCPLLNCAVLRDFPADERKTSMLNESAFFRFLAIVFLIPDAVPLNLLLFHG